MNSNILQVEKDIYELLCDDDLYEMYIDNVHYANYIIYTDNFGINYRVFIHDELLYHDVEFFIESFNYKNKLIILAYEQDVPMVILFEDNSYSSDKYNNYVFKDVNTKPKVIATEECSSEEIDIFQESTDEIVNYDTIQLFYNENENVYKDSLGNKYKICTKDNSKRNKMIRHYKLIQKDNDWYNTTLGKNSHSYNIKFIDNTEASYCLLEISQDPNKYNNLYQDEGFSAHNEHREEPIYFSRYYSQEELKNKLKNDALLASYSYANKINKDYTKDEDFMSAINECVNNYDNKKCIYLRLAPSVDMRISQYERALKINKIYSAYNNDYINKLAQDSQIPIFNDNLLYSESKYNYIKHNIEAEPIRNLGD
jgi:hypothetical protein